MQKEPIPPPQSPSKGGIYLSPAGGGLEGGVLLRGGRSFLPTLTWGVALLSVFVAVNYPPLVWFSFAGLSLVQSSSIARMGIR